MNHDLNYKTYASESSSCKAVLRMLYRNEYFRKFISGSVFNPADVLEEVKASFASFSNGKNAPQGKALKKFGTFLPIEIFALLVCAVVEKKLKFAISVSQLFVCQCGHKSYQNKEVSFFSIQIEKIVSNIKEKINNLSKNCGAQIRYEKRSSLTSERNKLIFYNNDFEKAIHGEICSQCNNFYNNKILLIKEKLPYQITFRLLCNISEFSIFDILVSLTLIPTFFDISKMFDNSFKKKFFYELQTIILTSSFRVFSTLTKSSDNQWECYTDNQPELIKFNSWFDAVSYLIKNSYCPLVLHYVPSDYEKSKKFVDLTPQQMELLEQYVHDIEDYNPSENTLRRNEIELNFKSEKKECSFRQESLTINSNKSTCNSSYKFSRSNKKESYSEKKASSRPIVIKNQIKKPRKLWIRNTNILEIINKKWTCDICSHLNKNDVFKCFQCGTIDIYRKNLLEAYHKYSERSKTSGNTSSSLPGSCRVEQTRKESLRRPQSYREAVERHHISSKSVNFSSVIEQKYNPRSVIN